MGVFMRGSHALLVAACVKCHGVHVRACVHEASFGFYLALGTWHAVIRSSRTSRFFGVVYEAAQCSFLLPYSCVFV